MTLLSQKHHLNRRNTKRNGHTLIELTVGLLAATMLMSGLASALIFSGIAFEGQSSSILRSETAQVYADMMDDLEHAKSFTSRTATSATFKVADRDNDAVDETITYNWNSGSNQLEYTYNGSNATLLENVTAFQLAYQSRVLNGSASAPPAFDSNDWGTRWQVTAATGIVFEEFTEAKVNPDGNLITINKPSGTSSGDLLIAAVSVANNVKSELHADDAGWTELYIEQSDGDVTFGVWWKIAGGSEPSNYGFDWTSNEKAYGWIMRFTGHDSGSPIHTSAFSLIEDGDTEFPTAPSVTTTVDQAMILRLGGFDKDDIITDDPGLPGHVPITMDDSSGASGGAGYLNQSFAGSAGTSDFVLENEHAAVTVTIAIAPASGS